MFKNFPPKKAPYFLDDFFKCGPNKFKNQFRHIIHYSMPESILFVFRKRLNFIFLLFLIIGFLIFTLL